MRVEGFVQFVGIVMWRMSWMTSWQTQTSLGCQPAPTCRLMTLLPATRSLLLACCKVRHLALLSRGPLLLGRPQQGNIR